MPYVPGDTGYIDGLLRDFGAELRRCRETANLSQNQLAERSGVSQSTISRMERGLAARAALWKLIMLALLSIGVLFFFSLLNRVSQREITES